MPARKRSPRTASNDDPLALSTLLRRLADNLENHPSPGNLRKLHTEALAALRELESQPLTPASPEAPHDGIGMKLDREANAMIQLWGHWSLDDFLDRWKTLAPKMLERACPVLGLPTPKTWRLPQKTQLHKRAQRFARNTLL